MADGYSDPEDASGYSAHDLISLGFKKSRTHAALLKGTKSIADVDARGLRRDLRRPAASHPW